MNIGRPKRIIEVQPVSLPLPEELPDALPAPETTPASDPAPAEPATP